MVECGLRARKLQPRHNAPTHTKRAVSLKFRLASVFPAPTRLPSTFLGSGTSPNLASSVSSSPQWARLPSWLRRTRPSSSRARAGSPPLLRPARSSEGVPLCNTREKSYGQEGSERYERMVRAKSLLSQSAEYQGRSAGIVPHTDSSRQAGNPLWFDTSVVPGPARAGPGGQLPGRDFYHAGSPQSSAFPRPLESS